MADIEALRKGDAKLEAEEITLLAARNKLKDKENTALTELREAAKKYRAVRTARAEIQRQIREQEDPRPPVTPEVETIIQSVVSTAQSANSPPAKEA